MIEYLQDWLASFPGTLLMVTHDLSIADHADRIFKMDNGRLTLFRDKDGYRRNSFEEDMANAQK